MIWLALFEFFCGSAEADFTHISHVYFTNTD